MKVRRFFLRLLPRLGIFVLSVLLLSVLTFYISRLAPGDPLVSYYGDRVEKMSPAEREWAEDKLGLNDPPAHAVRPLVQPRAARRFRHRL